MGSSSLAMERGRWGQPSSKLVSWALQVGHGCCSRPADTRAAPTLGLPTHLKYKAARSSRCG